MAEIIFSYEGKDITIHCRENETMKDIINKFITKAQIDEN